VSHVPLNAEAQNEVHRQVQEMKDEELVQFIRDTVVRLEVLADRLDTVADMKEDHGAGKHTATSD
jgi:nitrogen-specific signal transduction histidine kinase